MCTTCGCTGSEQATITAVHTHTDGDHVHTHSHGDQVHTHGNGDHVHTHDGHTHAHPHPHEHQHHDEPPASAALHGRTVALELDILAKNQLLAERNRGWFAGREVLAVNLMSSPGAGKTSILERTIRDLHASVPIAVLEGDQATANDALRVRAAGAPVVQINTGTGCHLDADMVARGVQQLNPSRGSVLLVENVGNLVCPALFDLGEQAKVVVLSVTEGDDKPLKYLHMFRACEVLLINKIDLLPYVRFDVERCIAHARQANPDVRVFRLSAETGEGMQAWYEWMRSQRPAGQAAAVS